MDSRNCGFCTACVMGQYDQCETRADEQRRMKKVVYVLEDYDRWDEFCPWDVVGFTYDKAEAQAWVDEAKKYRDCARRMTEVKHMEVKI